MRPLAVFDIDGVLADVQHRLHYVEGPVEDWNRFFAAARHDPPLIEGVALARESAKECNVVSMTGHPARCRADTAAWLAPNGLPDGRLEMRRDGDRRPAMKTKPGLLPKIAKGSVVAVVVDDDPLVCGAYERPGFRVIHATWATQPVSLERAQGEDGQT